MVLANTRGSKSTYSTRISLSAARARKSSFIASAARALPAELNACQIELDAQLDTRRVGHDSTTQIDAPR